MEKTIKLSKVAQEFLFYSYFGKSYGELKNCIESGNEDEAIKICFRAAYLDFNRTMKFKGKGDDADFPDEMFERKYGGTNLYSMIMGILDGGPEKFDDNHENICDALVDIAGEISYVKKKNNKTEFSYGQAQKWVNMTLKYMYLTGLWKDKFLKIQSSLHIPLDSYILKAVFNKKIRTNIENSKDLFDSYADKCNYAYSDGTLKYEDLELQGEYPKDDAGKIKPIAWSKINCYEDYKKIQYEIKECMAKKYKKDGKCPLVWENKVWLLAAKK